MSRKLVLTLLLCFLAAMPASSEVADSGSNGFTVKIAAVIHASPEDVYKKLVHNVGDWWDSRHTFSGDAHNLSIEERPGGCFCEKLAAGGGVRHLEVVYLAPGKILRLSGGLGPLQAIGAGGALSFNLTADKDGTKLDLTYAVNGYLTQGMNTFAAPVDRVLGEQIARLKNYVETGKPDSASQPK